MLNGHPKQDQVWRRVSAYVEQVGGWVGGWGGGRTCTYRRVSWQAMCVCTSLRCICMLAAAAASSLDCRSTLETLPLLPRRQTDIHTATATVREALLFSARLRLPSGVPNADVAE